LGAGLSLGVDRRARFVDRDLVRRQERPYKATDSLQRAKGLLFHRIEDNHPWHDVVPQQGNIIGKMFVFNDKKC
jgi:hypothetical protein